MVNPQNYTGENPLWTSTEPYFDSFYWLVLPAGMLRKYLLTYPAFGTHFDLKFRSSLFSILIQLLKWFAH